MANRALKRPFTHEVGDTLLRFKIPIGAVGAVGTVVPPLPNHAVKSVTRNSAGNYTIVFADPYPDFQHVHAQIHFPSAGAVLNPALQVRTWAYTPSPASGGATMVLQVVTLASPEVAADAPTGTEIHVSVWAKNSKLAGAG